MNVQWNIEVCAVLQISGSSQVIMKFIQWRKVEKDIWLLLWYRMYYYGLLLFNILLILKIYYLFIHLNTVC